MLSIYEQVDENTTPKKRIIGIPSLASIEEMRASAAFNDLTENMISDNRSKGGVPTDSKIQQQQGQVHVQALQNRAPFGCVN